MAKWQNSSLRRSTASSGIRKIFRILIYRCKAKTCEIRENVGVFCFGTLKCVSSRRSCHCLGVLLLGHEQSVSCFRYSCCRWFGKQRCVIRNTFQSAKTRFTKASKSRPSRLKRTQQIYDYSKRSTFENTNLPPSPEKNAANSRTFYFNNYFNISRDSSYFDTHSLVHSIHFYSYLYLVNI